MSTENGSGANRDDDLNRALQQQVEGLDGSPLSLGDVQARAKQIQRRRRVVASVSAAAAVAIIAPIGLILANNQPEASGPSDQPSTALPTATGSTPSAPSSSASTPSGPPTYTIDVDPPADQIYDGLLAIPYWYAGALSSPDGAVPIADPVQNAVREPSNGQWGGVVQDEQANYKWTSFDNSGADLQSVTSLNAEVAVTPDGSQYAYLSKEGADDAGSTASWQLTLGGASSGAGWPLGSKDPAQPGTGPVGILSDGTVVFEFEAGKPMLARSDGSIDPLPGKYLKTTDASTATGRIAVQTSYNENNGTSCWAVVDQAGNVQAQTCKYALEQFSADGSYLIGYDSATDALGPTAIYLLDASSLEPLATFRMPRNGFFWSQTAWSGDTILANAYSAGTWHVELLNLDGPQQLAGISVEADEFTPPARFGAGPLTVD